MQEFEKMKKALSLLFILTIVCFLISTENSIAGGPPGPPGGGGDPPCWPPPCIPIDGGIGLLIAAGVAYGSKKTYDIQKGS